MKKYTVDKYDLPLHDWTEDKEKNPYIVETAGFQPLEVQIQRFEQAGVRAKFRSEMFDSQDYRDMYLGPDTRITADDDLEEIERKIENQNYVRQAILAQRQREYQEQMTKNGSFGAYRANDGKSGANDGANAGSEETTVSPPAGTDNQ